MDDRIREAAEVAYGHGGYHANPAATEDAKRAFARGAQWALIEAERAIRERATRFDHPIQWVARDLLQTVARMVANLRGGDS